MGQFTLLTAADGQKIPAYMAQAAGQAKGAIVVIQEIFGVNSHIRAVADSYAAAGYLALAPAIFGYMMYSGASGTRSLRPFMSSGLLIALLAVVLSCHEVIFMTVPFGTSGAASSA